MGICGEGQSGPDQGSLTPGQPGISTVRVQPKKLKVFGHVFDSDTRTVLVLLELSGVHYDFEEIDIFLGKH